MSRIPGDFPGQSLGQLALLDQRGLTRSQEFPSSPEHTYDSEGYEWVHLYYKVVILKGI